MAKREHPRYENTEWPDYEYREYPRMVYPGAADQAKPYGANGKPLRGIIVNNAAEEAEALGLEEEAPPVAQEAAAAPRKPSTVPTSTKGVERLRTADDDKADALAEAEALGVKIDKAWSLARIQDAIDTHKQGEVV